MRYDGLTFNWPEFRSQRNSSEYMREKVEYMRVIRSRRLYACVHRVEENPRLNC